MKAAVFTEVGQPLQVEELQLESPKAGEVRIDIVGCGVCHSDLHIIDGDWTHRTPIVLGHEGAGVVSEVGPGVESLAVGDHVIASWMPACGRCRQCAVGRPWLCEAATEAIGTDTMFDGTTRLSRADGETVYQYLSAGMFAEQAVIPAGGAIKIRPDAPLEKVCIIGCAVATGFGAVVNTAHMAWGSRVAVIGLGAVGLSVIQGANSTAAARIIAVDKDPAKLDIALRFGATDVVDASALDAAEAVKDLCGGVDYAFECVGLAVTCEQAVNMLDLHGTAVIVGQPKEGTRPTYDGLWLSCLEYSIVGCNYGSVRPQVDFPKLVDLYMAGKLAIDELITGHRPLAEANEAFEDLAAGRALRTVLDCAAAKAADREPELEASAAV
jgi:S-(hydroxymethyl)glutathione dehydrogenase / alcohol dehydrogenase